MNNLWADYMTKFGQPTNFMNTVPRKSYNSPKEQRLFSMQPGQQFGYQGQGQGNGYNRQPAPYNQYGAMASGQESPMNDFYSRMTQARPYPQRQFAPSNVFGEGPEADFAYQMYRYNGGYGGGGA